MSTRLLQNFQYGKEQIQAVVFTDAETGQKYIPMENILDSYPDVTKVLLDGAPVPFLTDAFLREYNPPRIPHYPGETLKLVPSSPGSLQSIDATPPVTATPPPIPPRPSSQERTMSTQYLLLDYNNHVSGPDQRQEEYQPFHPNQNHTNDDNHQNHDDMLLGQQTFRFEGSLAVRLTLFGFIVFLVITSQLAGLSSKVIDGYMGGRDELKQRIVYWATGCSIIHGVMLYFLARWFTKDLAWHWDFKDLHHLWGLSPSVSSVMVAFRVRAPSIIVIAFILTFIAIFAMFINLWLTSATFITSHNFQSPFNNITLKDIPWMKEDNFSFGYQDASVFDSFVQQGSIGNLGILQLTPYQGRYFWAPIFQADKPTDIFIENVRGFSINPVCRQLNNTELGVPYSDPTVFGSNRTVHLGPFNATIPGLRGHSQYWGFFADEKSRLDSEDRETIQIYNIQANKRREFGAPTFEFNTHETPDYIYAVTCNVTAEAWNITGYLSSYRPQRLYNIQSVTHLSDVGLTYMWWTLRGLDRWTKITMAHSVDNIGRGLHSMMWMWMQGRRYTNYEQEVPLIDIPIVDWTRQKLTEIMAATLTTATASIQPRAVRGAYLIETSIITVSVPKLIGGLMIQLSFVSIIVGLYIFKRRGSVYRSDDITCLLKKDAVEIGR